MTTDSARLAQRIFDAVYDARALCYTDDRVMIPAEALHQAILRVVTAALAERIPLTNTMTSLQVTDRREELRLTTSQAAIIALWCDERTKEITAERDAAKQRVKEVEAEALDLLETLEFTEERAREAYDLLAIARDPD